VAQGSGFQQILGGGGHKEGAASSQGTHLAEGALSSCKELLPIVLVFLEHSSKVAL
jgi:hypothetical protein